jgi:ferritin-like metal-binding protein YciE
MTRMSIKNPKALLTYELSALMTSKTRVLEFLNLLQSQCKDEEVSSLLSWQLQEACYQLQTLQHAAGIADTQPVSVPCHTFDAFQREWEDFLSCHPRAELQAQFLLHLTLKAKYFEITSYRVVIEQAKALNFLECARRLEMCLQRDQDMILQLTQKLWEPEAVVAPLDNKAASDRTTGTVMSA